LISEFVKASWNNSIGGFSLESSLDDIKRRSVDRISAKDLLFSVEINS